SAPTARRRPATRTRPPLPKAPRADIAPVEGKEGPRSSKAGGFEGAAREMQALNTQEFSAPPTTVEKKPEAKDKGGKTKIGVPVDEKSEAKPDTKKDPKPETKKDPEKK
ncbi:MAG TPA: hypothetical protein VHB97_17830, partial [Polyangia bacterium]|nr:hypothetical protein [Polyangia bacterium]